MIIKKLLRKTAVDHPLSCIHFAGFSRPGSGSTLSTSFHHGHASQHCFWGRGWQQCPAHLLLLALQAGGEQAEPPRPEREIPHGQSYCFLPGQPPAETWWIPQRRGYPTDKRWLVFLREREPSALQSSKRPYKSRGQASCYPLLLPQVL